MAIKIPLPDELAAHRERAHAAELDRLTALIVEALEDSTGSWPVTVHVVVDYKLRDMLARRFREVGDVGWILNYRSEQRDGSWVEVHPSNVVCSE